MTTVQCLLCGKHLRRAGPHFVSAHNMTAHEYRQQTGLDTTPRPETCPNGHSLADAPTRPDGLRECLPCTRSYEHAAYHERPEVAARKRAGARAYVERPEVAARKREYQRGYQQRPEAVARRKARQATPEFKALAARRQRERRARTA